MDQQLKITICREDRSFWATVEDFPGVFATGDTLDELRESLIEGISLWLAEPGQEPPKISMGELAFDEPLHTQAHAQLAYA